MAIINEIKCARCDRKYSGVRSRCPYCGARRIGRGKYSEDSENAKGKMLISVLILSVFIVAAGILLFSMPIDADALNNDAAISSDEEEDDDLVHGLIPEPIATPTPTPEPPVIAPPEVISIIITYGGNPIRDNDFSQPRGVPIELGVRVEPVGIDAPVEWEGVTIGEKDWEDIFEFSLVVGGVRIEGIEPGSARISAKAGDLETSVIVRIT